MSDVNVSVFPNEVLDRNDIDFVAYFTELTNQGEEDQSKLREWLQGDNAVHACHLLQLAVEFNHVLGYDNNVRRHINKNFLDDECVIDKLPVQ